MRAQESKKVILRHDREKEDASRGDCDGWLRQARDEGEADVRAMLLDYSRRETEVLEMASGAASREREKLEWERDNGGSAWDQGAAKPKP